MLGLGLFGCGRIGRVHAATIARSSKARLVAVYDAIDTVAREVAESYGADVRLADEMMASADIDAILICSPTPTHFDLIKAAAAAGKPVFCEKTTELGEFVHLNKCGYFLTNQGWFKIAKENRK